MTTRLLQVFLCHASSDKPIVEGIYRKLARITASIRGWTKKLVGGQDWNLEIKKAVRTSHIVLTCLTQHSITKEGYVQDEIQQALDEARKKPPGTIYLIPLRLEDCEVPEELNVKHRIDWFGQNGFRDLHRALQLRAATLGIEINTPQGRVVFDTNSETKPWSSWTTYSVGPADRSIQFLAGADGKDPFCRLEASGKRPVGVNKPISALVGTIEFDYQVEKSSGRNVVFYAIPMRENQLGRGGLLEVGGRYQDDPRNATSPHRLKLTPPVEHTGDGLWHRAVLEFDFQDISNAFFTIFEPRLNEGCDGQGPGAVLITRIMIAIG